MLMQATTVRVSSSTRRTLARLAEATDSSVQSVLTTAVESYRRHVLLDRANHDFAKLRKNPKAWAQYRKELARFEATGADGV